jgi:hypothetical protein
MLQPTNQSKKQQSRCSFCGSTNRGKGCRYAPHGVHFHPSDLTKCSYCGSTSFGRGCKLNPTSDLHIRGSIFNNMLKDSVQNFMDNEFLIRELKKDYKHFECCKLGIIDEQGNKIKVPITEAEQQSFSPFVRTILRLKKFLGTKIDLIEATTLLENEISHTEDIVKYKKMLVFKDRLNEATNEIFKILDEAVSEGLTVEEVKKLIKA